MSVNNIPNASPTDHTTRAQANDAASAGFTVRR